MPMGGGAGVALPVGISSGGTGATTAAAARSALGAAAQGSHTLKRSTGSGNYTINSTTFAAIDDTNLLVTVTVPTGMLALAMLMANCGQASGSSGEIGVAIDGTVQAYTVLSGTLSATNPVSQSVMAVLTGDGSSHTFSPQARVQVSAASVLTILNGDAVGCPWFLVALLPAN